MSGKWHVTGHIEPDGPQDNWPMQRGFDDYYGILCGAANYYNPRTLTRGNKPIEPEGDDYYLTDAISEHAVRQIQEHAAQENDKPFFQYVAYTAPHWPLHAHAEDIRKYKGRFDAGWDQLRTERLKRMQELEIIHPDWQLTERDPEVSPWEEAENKEWEAGRMEVYAAQVDRIGTILQALKDTGQRDNTLIIFLADNGGCAEELSADSAEWLVKGRVGTGTTRNGTRIKYGNTPNITPGDEDSYSSYGIPWANLSNTPFRLYKHWVHEGGIATPFIAHWPAGIEARGELRHQPAQLPDVMATFLDAAGIDYPEEYNGREIKPLEGISMVPTFTDQPHGREYLIWEHEGNKAIRKGRWKLVRKYPGEWELYDMETCRTETDDVSADHPEIAAQLSEVWDAWASRCNVIDWDELKAHRAEKRIVSP